MMMDVLAVLQLLLMRWPTSKFSDGKFVVEKTKTNFHLLILRIVWEPLMMMIRTLIVLVLTGSLCPAVMKTTNTFSKNAVILRSAHMSSKLFFCEYSFWSSTKGSKTRQNSLIFPCVK